MFTIALMAALAVVLLAGLRRTRGLGLAGRFAQIRLAADRGAITLADAQVNVQDDVSFAVIDETRRRSWLLDQLTFDDCVNPSGGGSTLTYGYTRLITPAPAGFRAFNDEYVAGKAVRGRYTVDLHPLGGSFEIDRVLARLGQAATNEEAFQFEQLTKSVRTRFQDEMINGNSDVDANGFDGLSKSLRGTSTELNADSTVDWTSGTINTETLAHSALDLLDELVNLVEGGAQAILGNDKSCARVRSIARRAGYYTRSEDALGRVVERFGNSVIVDLGYNTDGSAPIIPIETRDPDSAQYTLQVTGSPTGGTYTLLVNGTATAEIAYNAVNADIKAAIDAVDGAPTCTVTGTSTKTIKFNDDEVVTLAKGTTSLTGGTSPDVTVTGVGTNTGTGGLTDLYAVRFGLDAFHAVSTVGQLVNTYRPDYTAPGAVKKGEVEMGPLAGVLKATRGAAVLRNIQVQ